MATQNLPRQFGKYVLMRKIAMGGMAEIFKAKTAGAEGFEKDIVIKRILPHFTEDEAFVKMFIDEASITSKLQHANIVQIFDFDLCEGTYFIAMEYVEGVDLKKVIDDGVKNGQPLSIAQCVWIMMELSKGLHYAHVKEVKGKPLNIVHRDISPHNAMVSFTGEVKLMDFGIAKAAQRSTKTMAGTVKGKVAYMSPEQARGKPLDGRSDLFALGIMLWEMLTHKRLFLGDSDFETLTNVLKSEAPAPSTINPKVPKEIDEIVLKTLAKDRDERHPNVEAFNRDLTRWYYSNVTDLEGEALKPFMQKLFAEDIEKLKAFAAEEKGLPRPSADAPPADADRTVALPAGGYDPQQAQTLLDDGSISQQQIQQALQQQAGGAERTVAMPVGTGTYTQQGFTGTYTGQEVPQKKGKGLLIALAILLLGGGGFAAWFFLGQGKSTDNPNVVDTNAPPTVADAELVLMVTPREALVKVNGDPVDGRATGLEIGKRARVEAVAPGYKPYEELVMIEEKSQPLEIKLEKEAEEVSLVIEATGDEKAIIEVNGVAKPSPYTLKGHKGDKLEIKVTPSNGAPEVKETIVLDGSSPIHKIAVGPAPSTEVKMLVSLSPAGAKVEASSGSVSFTENGSQAIVAGLKIGDEVTLEVSEKSHETKKETFKVTGDNQVVSISLEKKKVGPGTTVGGTGTVTINAKPWAQITVDGKPVGTTPKTVTLSAGKHTIVLTKGSQKQTKSVTVKGGGKTTVTHDFTM
ncbi:MAG: PEGA domain-containing protein [Deltaproteobacteria bacterium]|nr:MAG: PEGA domain-containing protein [Deltaproteobacteria bacterium]